MCFPLHLTAVTLFIYVITSLLNYEFLEDHVSLYVYHWQSA